jgi:CHAT domain-containing protein
VKILLLTLFHLLITTTSFGEGIGVGELKEDLQKGNIESFEKDINKLILSTSSNKELADLYKLYGNYYKLCGRIDEAGEKWRTSNEYRNQAYPTNDYHKSWNHALLSNYYYEKINTPLAIVYADSCTKLIQDLSEKEQLELDIHLIYNILAQSYKQKHIDLSYLESLNLYAEIQPYYSRSIAFQLKHNLSQHDLAKTYHLFGNSHLDLALKANHYNELRSIDSHYSRAVEMYDKSIEIWTSLYGTHHYERGKTLFLKGLLNFYVADVDSTKIDVGYHFFRQAINSFDLDNKKLDTPNKEDLLMLLKYANMHIMKYKPNSDYLTEAQNYNSQAINVWLEIVNNSSINQSQNLAIYNLNPYEERINILLEKEKSGITLDHQLMFDALQHLKNYDLLKANNIRPNDDEFSLFDFQKSLREQDVFIDIQTIKYNNTVLVTTISKNDFNIHKLPDITIKETDTLINAIVNFDYNTYTKKSRLLYNQFFNQKNIEGKNIIICADGNFQKLPFEALLSSDIGLDTKDYRELDYAINHAQFSHIWNSLFLKERANTYEYSLAAFAPGTDTLSNLPFSSKLINFIDSENLGLAYLGSGVTKKSIMSVNTNILHLSSHGIIDQDQSYFSELVINKERIRLRDVGEMKLIPKLVSLNTCNSSLGKSYVGEGVDGFERVFVMNGCESLLTNIWEVDDMASNEIMKLFYINLHNGMSSREAIRQAKLANISSAENSELASPYYWAGHRISGLDLKFKKHDDKSQNYLLIILTFSLVFIGGYILFRRLKAF